MKVSCVKCNVAMDWDNESKILYKDEFICNSCGVRVKIGSWKE